MQLKIKEPGTIFQSEYTTRGAIRKYIIGSDAEAKKQAFIDIKKEIKRNIPKFNYNTRAWERYEFTLQSLTYGPQRVAQMLGNQTIFPLEIIINK